MHGRQNKNYNYEVTKTKVNDSVDHLTGNFFL